MVLLDQVAATFAYLFSLPGAFAVGPGGNAGLLVSIVIVGAVLLALWPRRGRPLPALLIVAVPALFFSLLLNCLTLYDAWNLNMDRLGGPLIYRHTIVAFWAFVMIVAAATHGLASKIVPFDKSSRAGWLSIPVVAAVILHAGWGEQAGLLNQGMTSPNMGNSHWHELSSRIDSGDPVCVPIDPYQWVFGVNCQTIGALPAFGGYVLAEELSPLDQDISLFIPPAIADHVVTSFSLLVRGREASRAVAFVTLKGGEALRVLAVPRALPQTGGALLFSLPHEIQGADIRAIQIPIGMGTEVAVDMSGTGRPMVTFMGR